MKDQVEVKKILEKDEKSRRVKETYKRNKHWQMATVNDVSDGEDVGHGRLESWIDGDSAAIVGAEADALQTQFVGVRPSADAN